MASSFKGSPASGKSPRFDLWTLAVHGHGNADVFESVKPDCPRPLPGACPSSSQGSPINPFPRLKANDLSRPTSSKAQAQRWADERNLRFGLGAVIICKSGALSPPGG